VGVDKYTIIHPELQANNNTKSASCTAVAFPEAMGRLSRDVV
jgi:hypothetical protein